MSIFRFSVGSDAKSMAVPCVFAIGVVCWANSYFYFFDDFQEVLVTEQHGPFGSVKSLHSFLRVAHSLWAILVKEFAVAWTNYFDDFVTFAKTDEVASVPGSIKFVFEALGWLFAEDGTLGVQINVENMHCGVVTIDNTAGRKSDLLQLLDDVISSKKLSRIDALRRRLQFAAGQFAGRIARKSFMVAKCI